MGEREKLAAALGDKDLVDYFYLNMDAPSVVKYLNELKLEITESQDEVPFNAQVKSYLAARDERGDPWIIKPVGSDEEMVYHRSCMLAYLLDHETGTFAAPTTAVLINGKKYRVTKVVRHSVQISSYNYLEAPFIGILRSDLVNRWIYFDEDRNPNNYLVITNSKNAPFVVAIDYDKADMLSDTMKITGMTEKFGWLRAEKTRFLTLLRPDNFNGASIADFEERLAAFREIKESSFLEVAKLTFNSWCPNSDELAAKVTANFIKRRDYVDCYFHTMFKSAADTKDLGHNSDYSAFGKSFLDMHNKKK